MRELLLEHFDVSFERLNTTPRGISEARPMADIRHSLLQRLNIRLCARSLCTLRSPRTLQRNQFEESIMTGKLKFTTHIMTGCIAGSTNRLDTDKATDLNRTE